MPALESHPSREDLEAFALGRLDDGSHAGVEEHVDTCSSCQQIIEHVPGDAFVALLRSAESVSDAVKALDGATMANTGADTPVACSMTSPWLSADAKDADIPAALLGHPRYEPLRLLGSGGMGTVWLAQHRVMGRQVAVKLIRSDLVAKPGAAERFRREAQAAARLAHPNIVAAFDAEQVGDQNMLAMEYVDGVNLADELRRRGRLPVAEACDIVRQSAVGLEHAFECGLIHRDLKPHNLMRTADGTVKILDFGLAVLADSGARGGDLTGQNVVLGTPDYIAPEQAEDSHAADIRSDIYALGCTLYHLLTGRVPFPGDSVLRKLDGHRMQEPEPLRTVRPEVPAELAAVVARMMAKKPAARYQTPAEVARALAPFACGTPPVRKRPRNWALVAAAALLAGIVVGAGVVYRIQTDNGDVVITPESPDVEIVLLKGNREIEVIDTKTNKRVTVPTGVYDVVLKNKPDGIEVKTDRIVVSRGKEVLVTIERVAKAAAAEKVGEVRRFEGHTGSVRGIAYAPDGRHALSASGWPTADRTIRLWDLGAGKEAWTKIADPVYPVCVTCSPDGSRAVSGGESGQLRLWETATGKEIRAWTHGQPIYCVAFTPDGKRILSGGYSGLLRIWDADTGKRVKEIKDRNGWITSLDVSPDSSRAVTGGGGDLVRVLDLRSGAELLRLETDGRPVAFGPGGRSILTGGPDKKIRLRDVESGKEIREFIGHTAAVMSVALLPDDSRILSAASDGTIRLWDLATGKELHRFEDSPAPLPPYFVQAVVSPDGRYAFSGNSLGICRLWRLPEPQNR
jgi:serine/threonine protein kinase